MLDHNFVMYSQVYYVQYLGSKGYSFKVRVFFNGGNLIRLFLLIASSTTQTDSSNRILSIKLKVWISEKTILSSKQENDDSISNLSKEERKAEIAK